MICNTDWTDHGRPDIQPSPHDHLSLPNPSGGSLIRGDARPFKIIFDESY